MIKTQQLLQVAIRYLNVFSRQSCWYPLWCD